MNKYKRYILIASIVIINLILIGIVFINVSNVIIRNISNKNEVNLGDINKDGEITEEDTILLRKYITNIIDFDNEQKQNADMNNDGTISIVDLSNLIEKISNAFNN